MAVSGRHKPYVVLIGKDAEKIAHKVCVIAQHQVYVKSPGIPTAHNTPITLCNSVFASN